MPGTFSLPPGDSDLIGIGYILGIWIFKSDVAEVKNRQPNPCNCLLTLCIQSLPHSTPHPAPFFFPTVGVIFSKCNFNRVTSTLFKTFQKFPINLRLEAPNLKMACKALLVLILPSL